MLYVEMYIHYIKRPTLDGHVETEDILLRRLDPLLMLIEISMLNVSGIHLF